MFFQWKLDPNKIWTQINNVSEEKFPPVISIDIILIEIAFIYLCCIFLSWYELEGM